ncbi:hypothetical protein L3Q82_003016 [Scortum barcoo]|uniref:Uncharacterized protein n=1 Tax=Scortum barcoo TaxID=214431 RepID=A0ACB8VQU6_9TELE|nr:hypothetical protein L3Q82_003016 [Scortum barcoo]
MASPNSSQTRVFASRTVRAAACLACRYPVNCVRSPTGQHGPIGLLLQPDGIPYFRCPPPGSGVAATTGTRDLASTTSNLPQLVADNGGREHGPLGLNVSPASLGICEKLFRRWELKTSLTEGSARRSQQTLTIRLGLPGLSNFLLCQRIQLTTRW